MNLETITLEHRDGVALITLSRPERLNAINGRMKSEVGDVLDAIEHEPSVGAVVLAGAGRAFSSGMDLKDDAAGAVRGAEAWRRLLGEDLAFIMRFWDFPKPTIAAVHGFCLAAACELAMACDVTIAEEGTFLGEPELRFGSVITAMLMPWLVGPKLAKELLLGADDRISAERAERIGLVNRVVPRGGGIEAALGMARRMAAMDADALRRTKLAINRGLDAMGLREALQAALDQAVEIEALETPSRRMFKDITRERGLKAAIEWREGRLAD
ncbi:MAG: enoyl-CoA hydratase/isomerase family protein [Pseudomonadota bacterium]